MLVSVLYFLKELAEKEEKLAERNEKNAERNERRVERELESREKDRELEFKKLQLREKELALKEIDSSNEIKSKIKLPKCHEGEDIEVFLTTFERLACVHKWPKSEWPIRIIPQLSGKALEAYSRMSITDSKEYEKIKKAII